MTLVQVWYRYIAADCNVQIDAVAVVWETINFWQFLKWAKLKPISILIGQNMQPNNMGCQAA